MKPNFKKRLLVLKAQMENLYSEFEELRADHQDWIDEHDYGWEDTTTGERATDEQYELQGIVDDMESAVETIDNILEGNL